MKLHIICTCVALIIGTVNTLKSLEIHVPKAIFMGRDAVLMCTYDLEDAELYSIKWYKNMVEFYRYVPKESPPTKVFPVGEIKVDIAASDQNRVVLTGVDWSVSGNFLCEVSADAPLFHTDIRSAEMVIVDPPLLGPNVTTNRKEYGAGDKIKLNCSSPPSIPAANITWYVNKQMVPSYTTYNEIKFSNGYASSLATLDLTISKTPVPKITIRCEASLSDIWRAQSQTLELYEHNSIPISALGRSLTGGAINSCIPTIMLVLLQFFLQFLLECYAKTSIR